MELKAKRFFSRRKSCSCSMPGVWRAAAYAKGAVVIFHSPRACAHVARTMDIGSHYTMMGEGRTEPMEPVPLLSSQLLEKHAIFGGTDRLQKCIAFAVKNYAPQCLIIANSCMSGVIGDDIEAIGSEAENKYAIPVITVTTAGFLDGEYSQGYIDTVMQLAQRFLKPQQQVKNTAILLGDSGGFWGTYAAEVIRLLGELDITVIGQFPGYMAIDDYAKVATAQASIILGNKNQTNFGFTKLAQYLKDEFNIDYMKKTYPISWDKTREWILNMGKLFGCTEKAERLAAHEYDRICKAAERFCRITAGKKTVLCIGRWALYFDPAPIISMAKLLKLDVQGVFLLPYYDDRERKLITESLQGCTDAPIYTGKSDEKDLIRNADLILTTHELTDKDLKQVFLPLIPKVGTEGEIDFMRGIYRALCSRSRNGGMYYV